MARRFFVVLVLLALLVVTNAVAQTPFTDVTTAVGINRLAPIPGDHHAPGALFVDLDGDGFPEVYICRGDPLGGPAPIRNALYWNVPGPTGRVYQLLTNTGAEDGGDSTGAIAADIDNDGDVDIYVLNFDSPNTMLQSQVAQGGGLTFIDITLATDPTPAPAPPDGQFGVGWAIDAASGILLDNSLTASFFDADKDGNVDLYVGNHNGYGGPALFVTIEGPDARPGRRDIFYMNNGNGTFTDVTTTMPGTPLTGFEDQAGAGINANQRYSSSNAVVAFDANNDNWPDLYVTNKVGGPSDADMLYLNQGQIGGVWQGFQNVSYAAGGAFATASPAAMGVAIGDWNNDLIFDAYVTDVGPNFLHTGIPTGGPPTYLTFTGPPISGLFAWGAEWFDFDNDSRVDLYVGNNAPLGQLNTDHLFWNLPAGFFEISLQAGIQPLTQGNDTRGVMTADYNKDGWPDVLTVPMLSGQITLLQNNVAVIAPQNNWLHLKLIGNPGGPGPLRSTADAIGARAFVTADFNGDGTTLDSETIMREVVSGSSNAGSTSSLKLEYGTGLGRRAAIRVLWPSGVVTALANIATNQCLTISEVGGAGPPC